MMPTDMEEEKRSLKTKQKAKYILKSVWKHHKDNLKVMAGAKYW